MTRIKRPAAAVGAAALLALSLTACGGGGSDAPDNASKDDFCKAFGDAFKPLFNLEGDPSEDDFKTFQDNVDKLKDVGTPDGITDDQRKGFEVFVDAVHDASYDDFKSDSNDIPGVSKEDQAKASDFVTYATTECASEIGIPTDLPTDIPTDLTDIPTDLTDIPTDLTDIPTDLPTDSTEFPTDFPSSS